MLEVQIQDKKLYEELKKYSEEHYDRTQVLCILEKYKDKIPSDYLVSSVCDGKPVLKYYGKKIIIEGITDEIRCYLDLYLKWDNTVSLNEMEKLYIMYNNDMFDVDGSFRGKFTKINISNAKVSDLAVSGKKYKINGKMFNPMIIGDVYLKDLFCDVETKSSGRHTNIINIESYIRGTDSKGRDRLEIDYNYTTNNNIFSGSTSIYNNIDNKLPLLMNSNKLNALFNKKGNIENFLPRELSFNDLPVYCQSKKSKLIVKDKVPVSMFRMMYYEYLLRND